jgi:hypothetical protein
MMPAKPVDPNTGKEIDYHSEHFRHIDELLVICNALLNKQAPRSQEDTRLICELRRKLRDERKNHTRIKLSNKELRQTIRSLESRCG